MTAEHRAPLRYAGQVGVPGKGERICGHCNGSGRDDSEPVYRNSGCDICEGTGVLPEAGDHIKETE